MDDNECMYPVQEISFYGLMNVTVLKKNLCSFGVQWSELICVNMCCIEYADVPLVQRKILYTVYNYC